MQYEKNIRSTYNIYPVLHQPSDTLLQIKLKQKNKPINLRTLTLTDTGMQICQLIQINSDESFSNTLLDVINKGGTATATLL